MSDDLPGNSRKRLHVLPLDDLGVAELHAYIADLRAEIARAELAIDRKQQHLGAADLVFGKRPGPV